MSSPRQDSPGLQKARGIDHYTQLTVTIIWHVSPPAPTPRCKPGVNIMKKTLSGHQKDKHHDAECILGAEILNKAFCSSKTQTVGISRKQLALICRGALKKKKEKKNVTPPAALFLGWLGRKAHGKLQAYGGPFTVLCGIHSG